jgi:hypothetical protein
MKKTPQATTTPFSTLEVRWKVPEVGLVGWLVDTYNSNLPVVAAPEAKK